MSNVENGAGLSKSENAQHEVYAFLRNSLHATYYFRFLYDPLSKQGTEIARLS